MSDDPRQKQTEDRNRVTKDFDKLYDAMLGARIKDDRGVSRVKDHSQTREVPAVGEIVTLRDYLHGIANSSLTFGTPGKDEKKYSREVKTDALELYASTELLFRKRQTYGVKPEDQEKAAFQKLARKVMEQQPEVQTAIVSTFDRDEKQRELHAIEQKLEKTITDARRNGDIELVVVGGKKETLASLDKDRKPSTRIEYRPLYEVKARTDAGRTAVVEIEALETEFRKAYQPARAGGWSADDTLHNLQNNIEIKAIMKATNLCEEEKTIARQQIFATAREKANQRDGAIQQPADPMSKALQEFQKGAGKDEIGGQAPRKANLPIKTGNAL